MAICRLLSSCCTWQVAVHHSRTGWATRVGPAWPFLTAHHAVTQPYKGPYRSQAFVALFFVLPTCGSANAECSSTRRFNLRICSFLGLDGLSYIRGTHVASYSRARPRAHDSHDIHKADIHYEHTSYKLTLQSDRHAITYIGNNRPAVEYWTLTPSE